MSFIFNIFDVLHFIKPSKHSLEEKNMEFGKK